MNDLWILFLGFTESPNDPVPVSHYGTGLLRLRDRLEAVDNTMPVEVYPWNINVGFVLASVLKRPDTTRIFVAHYSHGDKPAQAFGAEMIKLGRQITYDASIDDVPY